MLKSTMDRSWLVLGAGVLALALGCAPPAVEPAAPPKAKTVTTPTTPTAIQQRMRKVPVAMYMTEWCPYCTRAREWLQRGQYSFIEHDVEHDDRAAAVLLSLNPRGSVPMFDVDGLIVVGFEPAELHAAIRHAAEARKSGGGWGQAAEQ